MATAQVNPWRRFLKLLQIEKKDIYAIYFYAIAGGILSMSLPLGIQSVIQFIQSGQITTSWVILIVLVVLGAVLTGVMQIMQLRITENIQQRLFVRYAFDFAHRFPRFERSEINNENPNELINRFFDIMGLQKGFSKVLLDFTSALLQIVFSLFVLSLYHPFYIAFSILLVVLLALIFKPFIKRGLETSLKESKHKYATAFWLQEITRSSWSFRTSSDEQLSLNRLDKSASSYIKSREAHFQILARQFVWTIAFKVLIITSLLGLGGYLVISQQINLGQFVAAEVLILLLLAAVEKVIQSMDNLYDVCTSLEKLEQVRDIPVSFEENDIDPDVELFPVDIIRKGAQSSDKAILTLNKGDRSLLSGRSKFSTEAILKQCIENSVASDFTTRWNYQVPTGRQLEAGYTKIGWFSSESRIIDGNLMDNVIMQRPSVSLDDVKSVFKLMNIEHLYKDSPDGFNVQIAALQERLSLQDRERILISRAIVNKPQLLILSFWDSSLNVDDQKNLLQTVSTFLPETTILCASNEKLPLDWNSIEIN